MKHPVLFALAGALGLPSMAAAQSSVRTFLLMAGSDTVAVEQVNRSPGRLEGDLLFRSGNQRWHYIATIGPGEEISAFDNEFRPTADAPTAPPRQRAHFIFAEDSVLVTFEGPTPPAQRIATKPGAMPSSILRSRWSSRQSAEGCGWEGTVSRSRSLP